MNSPFKIQTQALKTYQKGLTMFKIVPVAYKPYLFL